ncbi:MAG TPA: DUF1289 domain-containing protein [Paracoccaceae bacterium]|nr:DUF1289 domain-containing protein [Paracoccaceae bacterium]
MKHEIWERDEIESPCVKICVVHPQARICIGCHRTPEEISRWSRLTSEERRMIMAELPSRAPMLSRRSGGRAGRLRRHTEGEGGAPTGLIGGGRENR